jgi:hypothetical protein
MLTRGMRIAGLSAMRTAACLGLCSLVACASLGKQAPQPNLNSWPEIRADVRVESLRSRMYEYSITFAAQVDVAAATIERRTDDAIVRRNTLLWRVRAIPEMRKASFRLEPVSALIDAWIFARQMDQLFREGAGASAFGTFQPEALEVSRQLVNQMRQIGGSIAMSPDATAEFERRVIDPWVAEHPLRDMTFVRESPIARFAEQSRARGDTLQSVGTIEDLAIGLSQQARIYLAELPRQVRGELDLMRSDLLPEGLADIQRDLHLSAAAVDRLASTAETTAPLMLSERRIILEEVSRQRALVMEAIAVERAKAVEAIVESFATERTELLRSFESQRLATLEWATAERREVLADVRGDLAASMEELRRIVDLVLLRVVLFLFAAVMLAPLVAHAYARVWPRRWHVDLRQ